MHTVLRMLIVLALAGPACGAAGTYHDAAALTNRIEQFAAAHPDHCTVTEIGTSREGRTIAALRIAAPGDTDPDGRAALLLVAGIDGHHLVGTEVALGIVGRLLDDPDDAASGLLAARTLYVIPRVNPDAAERRFADVRHEHGRAVRPVDDDRDRRIDEDPPDDLNGDGLITMMRVFDPERADMMPDPAAPRLNVAARADRGESPAFALMIEGIDDDGDGAFNEDGVGGVDLNRNFMHGYVEHGDGAGPHQVSEPESLALLKFVLDHQNIAAALVFGVHDTLSAPPDGKGKLPAGTPRNIHEDDLGLYTEVSRRFVEITGIKDASGAESAGAFHAWAYAEFGVPSFATPLWTHPPADDDADGNTDDANEPADANGGDEVQETLTPSTVGDISQETLDELEAAAVDAGFEVTAEMKASVTPAEVEAYARQFGIEVRRIGVAKRASGAAPSKRDDDGPRDKAAAAWLKYSDDHHGGAGFVPWTPFDHPQLGRVEIGGFMPYFRSNPPPELLPDLVDGQLAFVLELGSCLPSIHLETPKVTQLAAGLHEIRTALRNDGYLPTGTAMAEVNRRARPCVVRLDTPLDRIVSGQRVSKIWSVPGSGGRQELRWIVAAGAGETIRITVYSEKLGGLTRDVVLGATGAGGEP